MSAEEFVLIPKRQYIKDRPIPEQILHDPSLKKKAVQLTMLQRERPLLQIQSTEENEEAITTEKTVRDMVFHNLSSLQTPGQIRKSELILDQILNSDRLEIDTNGQLTLDGTKIGVETSTFLYDIQQPTKKIDTAAYTSVLNQLSLPSHLVGNKYAKVIVRGENATPIKEPTGKKRRIPWENIT